MALVFHVPWVLWFRPIVQQLIQLAASPIHCAAVRMSASGIPVISLTFSGVYSARKLGITSQPFGEVGDEVRIGVAVHDEQVE